VGTSEMLVAESVAQTGTVAAAMVVVTEAVFEAAVSTEATKE